ncbi:ML domain-containing protein [Chaetomium tenue]|uniref:ML domain-containing protein n=1 Tax=Chaetomium tenue TaxID=1854479 RepID=A0ACB7P5S4_9PEZI|nr:ML domain-containing protein [Chaetomium globosum]
MRFSPILLALAVSASARNVFRSGGQSLVKRDDNLKVPGESPLEFCDANRDNDLLTIDKVDLSPNPPLAGESLIITASGTVQNTIDEGAYVVIVVKYGYIQLLKTTSDLCEQLGNVDLKCPIEPGKLKITKSVDMPKMIPPGKYTVLADVYNADDEHITCLTATVNFAAGSLEGMIDL